jgi:hypothetical protein
MADIRFGCPGCNQTLEAPPEMAGEGVECPNCQTQMSVPQPESPAAPTEAPATGNQCPECQAGMDDGAVLCLQCGFHTKLGKKIQTDFS